MTRPVPTAISRAAYAEAIRIEQASIPASRNDRNLMWQRGELADLAREIRIERKHYGLRQIEDRLP